LAVAMTAGAAPRILVHGHRGARAARPENTLAGFQYAIDAGADFLELDVAVTRDNVPVVSHDPTPNAEICSGPGPARPIREMTLAELRRWDCGSKVNPAFPKQQPAPGARIPTLDEALALGRRGSFGFNIELKISPDKPQWTPAPEAFARMAAEAVRRHKLERRVIVQSFDFRTVAALKKAAPEMKLSALWNSGPRDFVSIGRETGARIVAPHFSLVTPEQVRAAHQADLEVVPWTANDPAEWNRLIAAEVDAIITDDPAALIAHLKARGLR
jgi:glycerophosphoryl diester phosphodiesterase